MHEAERSFLRHARQGLLRVLRPDRGEKGTDATVGDSLAAVWPEAGTWTEFTYVWDGARWWVGDPDEGQQTLIDLGDALQGKKLLRPAIKTPWAVIGRHSGDVNLTPNGHPDPEA